MLLQKKKTHNYVIDDVEISPDEEILEEIQTKKNPEKKILVKKILVKKIKLFPHP